MDLDLAGRVVLITGGSKGIGLACAHGFAAEGTRVAIASRDPAHLETAAASLRARGADVMVAATDLTKADAAREMAERVTAELGPVDVLVNCAGAARRYAPETLTARDWHDAMNAKYFTYIHAMQAVLPDMARRRCGSIVNVVGAGGKVAKPTHLPGGAANAALMLASVGLANAYGAHRVRINVVNPGATLTDRLGAGIAVEAARTGLSEKEVLQQQNHEIPLGRLATPEDVANMVVFLASEKAGYVTGAVIGMDGARVPTVI